jgi:hypothetical protein
MKKPNQQHDVSDLLALINLRTQYWKEIAWVNFLRLYPEGERSEFEKRWPTVLTNFFLVETIRAAKRLQVLNENRLN